MELKLVTSTITSSSSSSRSLLGAAALCDCSNASSCSYDNRRYRGGHNIIIVASKSKKKKQHQQQGSSSHSPPPPPPPRITSNAKENLRALKMWKEHQQRKSSTPRPSTSYRKKKAEKEDTITIHHDDDDDNTDYYGDPTTALYNTNQLGIIDNAVPVMLVDGYNVCGYWIKLKKHFMNGNLEIARQKLIHELLTFSKLRDLKVVVVFDAHKSGFPDHKECAFGIDIVFSSATSADTWIEKEVSALKEDGCPDVWVVTSDHDQQHAANGAGAYVWSCKTLITEIKEAQKEAADTLQEERTFSFQGKLLKHNLDAEVVAALKNLRQKLSEAEALKNLRQKLSKNELK
ncbi:uncharacterized protein LOC123910807 isoform X1 [Trifolium pratense]|nr:uncharacterized protein LOC123910807 isoform X1 [Trifolium pratense]XP_045818017.1 uncharacterized protein LOC123910807 isoform X1 [Trifolium pratense]